MITVQGAPTINVTIATIASAGRCIFGEYQSPIAIEEDTQHNPAYPLYSDFQKRAGYEVFAANQKD